MSDLCPQPSLLNGVSLCVWGGAGGAPVHTCERQGAEGRGKG